jgi:hypothetical protein
VTRPDWLPIARSGSPQEGICRSAATPASDGGKHDISAEVVIRKANEYHALRPCVGGQHRQSKALPNQAQGKIRMVRPVPEVWLKPCRSCH